MQKQRCSLGRRAATRRNAVTPRAGQQATLEQATKVAEKVAPRQLLIDGKFVDATEGKTFDVIDPTTERTIIKVADADSSDVDKAVRAARKAFDEGPWPRMTARERGTILYKLADLIEQNADELAMIESLDNGKPFSVSRNVDIPSAASHIRYYAGWADKQFGQTIPVDGPMWAYTLHEPIGVVGQIIPWNFPMLMAAWKIAPALACGNCVVLKPAEQTPMTALRMGQLALEAGLPPGVLNIVTGLGPEVGGPLVSHPFIDKVAFTGSTEVGRIIGKTAGELLKPVSLELGGKSPIIVDKSVDLDQAAKLGHSALFMNAGQCCAAGSRIYVHAAIYDEFVERSVQCAKKRSVGDPFTEVDQGPQVNNDQFEKIMGYIKKGQEEGASMRTGGKRIGDKGFFIEPTVFADVKDSMAISRDEIFGPVQVISKFDSLEEVVKRANDTPYGLASGVFANDINVVNYLTRALKAGTTWVNCYNVYDNGVPFGGYKDSGIGRDKGTYALHHYTQIKAVYQPLQNPAWL